MLYEPPANPAVRETLGRILASETFARSERARKLLAYLVEQEQAGQADRLKGFAIAVDVFGKAAEFDPSTDAVVRVQAGRLRELLSQYYAGEGATDPIRVNIPRGGYVPNYERVAWLEAIELPTAAASQPTVEPIAVPASAQPAPARRGPRTLGVMQHIQLFWGTMGIIVAMLGFLVIRILEPAGPVADASFPGVATFATSGIPASASQDVLPLVHIATRSQDAASLRVASMLRRALSAFDTVDFIGIEHESSGAPSPMDAIRFVFSISAGPEYGSVAIELQNTATGRVLLSRVLNPHETLSQALDDSIAAIATATVPASGSIYAFIEQSGLNSGLVSCLLLNDAYYLDQDAENLEAAYRCFEKLVSTDTKSPLVYSEMASLQLAAASDGYRYPPAASQDGALALAYRAVQMGATSANAHRAYGFMMSRTGSRQEAVRWTRKAYELNPFDLGMAATYGYTLVLAGNYAEGRPVIEHAVEVSTAHPSWWDYGLFLGCFMLGDIDRAATAADSLATSKRPHYIAARIVVADLTGKRDAVVPLLKELMREFPKFAADPMSHFGREQYPPELAEKFISALRAAGLGNAS